MTQPYAFHKCLTIKRYLLLLKRCLLKRQKYLFKQLPHGFAGGPAGDAAADPFGHLFRAAAENGLNVAEQAGQFVEEAAGFMNRHFRGSFFSGKGTHLLQRNVLLMVSCREIRPGTLFYYSGLKRHICVH